MERVKKVDASEDLFVIYSEEINEAYNRAVREALLMHKRAGNPVPIDRDGKVVWLQPDDIDDAGDVVDRS
jgi:hypothetical protein